MLFNDFFRRSGQDFSTILNLPQDVYAYKFNVDGEWRFAPEQPTAEDRHGGVNNFIDLKTFRSFHEGWRSTQVSDDVLFMFMYFIRSYD